MLFRLHSLSLTLLAVVLVLGLCSCGGSSDPTVATVGKTKISRSTLSHWMATMVGGDYQELVGSRAPAGLASEPADIPRCVAAAKQIKPKTLPASVANEATLKIRCRQLHTAIKEQALSYLISVLWRAEEGAEVGQKVSDREISQKVKETVSTGYQSPAAFRRFLASRRWSLGDERTLLKRNLLDTKFLERLKRQVAALGGSEKAFVKLVNENVAKWRSRTKCSPGYTAWQCRASGYSIEADPPPSILVEKLGGVVQ
jgi:hypothetical protein